jgi:hypothetical protein
MERILDAIHQTHGRAALEYLSVLNGNAWNRNHSALASLVKAGLLPYCVTLNFDLLIEKAVAAIQASCRTICSLVDKQFQFGDGPERIQLLKPYGSFVPEHVSPEPVGIREMLVPGCRWLDRHPLKPGGQDAHWAAYATVR